MEAVFNVFFFVILCFVMQARRYEDEMRCTV